MWRTAWRSRRRMLQYLLRPPPTVLSHHALVGTPIVVSSSLSRPSATNVFRTFSVAPDTIDAVESIREEEEVLADAAASVEESSPTKKNKKKKKPKTRKKKQTTKRPSTTKARKLFEHVAPHLPLKTLNDITKKLKQKAPKVTAETRVGQVHALLESVQRMEPWAKQRFSEFLLVKAFGKIKDQQNFPVTVNKESLNHHVDVLQRAQELSTERPLLWSVTQRRKEAKSKHAAAAAAVAATMDRDSIASGYNHKDSIEHEEALSTLNSKSKEETLPQPQDDSAEALVQLLAERLPKKAYKDLMASFANYVDETTNPKKPKMRMLYAHLNKCVFTHIHLVADQVATFFNVHHSTNIDPRLKQREKEWKAEEDKFVETVLEIFDSLGSESSSKNGNLEKNADTLGELDHLRTRPSDGVKVGRDRRKENARMGRPRKNVHLVFDAMLLQDEWTTSIDVQQHVAFVDNLPIDMDETELFDLYSRCGQVQSVQVFNQREELDPGPLTIKKRREQKIKQRQSTSRNRRHWKRPRTPVYGKVTFTSQQGYNAAVDAPLRIFGMVVRKHPMRSIRATDMTSLFVEDIPEGKNSLDIEHKLSQLLHPEIYVCLDVGQHDYAQASSCEIKFPSFEMANHAFQKLQELDIEGSRLQWMRTPDDAMKYWTREYTFET